MFNNKVENINKTKKIPYNKLTDENRKDILETYFTRIDITIPKISDYLNISTRAVARVLKDNNINTARLNRYTLNEYYFENIDTERKAYLLGLLFADGFVGDEKYNNVVIDLHKNDLHILEEFKNEIQFTGEIRETKSSGGFSKEGETSLRLNFSSKVMAKHLRDYGIVVKRSETMTTLPNIPSHLISHFIRGYFDGDGTISMLKRKSYRNFSGTTKLYEHMNYFFSIIGHKEFLECIAKEMNLESYSFEKSKNENMVYLNVRSKVEMPKIYDYLYKDSTIKLQRKYDKFNEIMGDIK
jgi:hypothetical protein